MSLSTAVPFTVATVSSAPDVAGKTAAVAVPEVPIVADWVSAAAPAAASPVPVA